MLLFSMLGWWYSRGWVWITTYFLVVRNRHIIDFFSVRDLLKTMFAPFRQDSIDTKRAPVGLKLQALGGNIISRIFGLLIRSLLVVAGLMLVVLNTVVGLVVIVIWPLLPFAPLVSGLLILLGVGLINV